MAAKGFSMASSSSSPNYYEVFLSFRGKDTRRNFTDHLYTALVRAGVNTFRDNNELQRGNDISSELLKAIQQSKISLVIFSRGYASSRWCLDELVKIIECKNASGKIVIPIFYDVHPSDVRNQRGIYGEAFAEHEERFVADNMEMIKKWRAALTEAADLSGWHLQNIADGHESKFIEKIVEDVLRKVNRNYLHVATHPVGIKPRIEKVLGLLRIGLDDVRVVGVYGMGGIGKTTIVKAVYNSICNGFDGSSFLSDVKDNSKQPNGLATIQQQLLSDILNSKSMIRVNNVDRGIMLIQERLCYRRVFIVLDDVDDSTQLKSLVGDRRWFGSGSRIIVTTRDERLLTELEVDEKYKVENLNVEESIQLFSWHAFRRPTPKDDYLQLSKSVLDHVQGLPLALEVLGSFLFKRSQLEWKSVVEKLRQIPHDQIQSKLRISFDSLDDQMKAIFLDIACFFIGMEKDYVMTILDGCGFFSVIGISVLLERSLITVNRYDQTIKMHDLIRDMGREIVREMSPNQIGKRSRLWFHQDVVNVLRKDMGTKAVEGLSLDVSAQKDVMVRTEAFAKMINLRLLKINSLHFSTGSYEKLSKDLRWLCWHRCPLQVLPPNLDLDNLVVLDLRFSNVKKVWKETKFLNKLKVVDLSYSIYLATTPDFARLTSLERLQLEGCTSLTKLHQSIGNLGRLVVLNLAECNNLRELPDNICNLTSLETLNLKGCSRLSKFPAHLGKLEALKRLVADGSTITELPTSFGLLKNLELLSLAGCKEELPANKFFFSLFSSWISPKCVGSRTFLPATLSKLSSLKELSLEGRNLSDGDISIDFGSFPILYHLCLKENKFYSLPVGVANHPRIMALALDDCTNLQSIPELPPNLLALKAERCTSLVTFPKLTDIGTKLCFFITTNCPNKVFNEGLDLRYWKPQWHLSWKDGNLSPPFVHDDEVPLKEGVSSPKSKYLEAYFPATEVPDWFEYKEMGSSRLMFRIPLVPNGGRLDMILWVVHGLNEDYDGWSATSLTTFFKNKTKRCRTVDWSFVNTDDKGICQDHAWVSYYMGNHIFGDLEADEGDEIEVSAYGQGRYLAKKYGIYLKPVDITSSDGIHD